MGLSARAGGSKGAMGIQIRRNWPGRGSGIGDWGLEEVLVRTICMHTTTTIDRILLRDGLYTTPTLDYINYKAYRNPRIISYREGELSCLVLILLANLNRAKDDDDDPSLIGEDDL